MGTHTQIGDVIGEEMHPVTPAVDEAQARTLRRPALELAATLSWLPQRPSSEAFSKRCRDLSASFKTLFDRIENAFARHPGSEDLLWLRTNAQQMAAAARMIASELGPRNTLPMVANKTEILPRSLAIARGFLDEVGSEVTKEDFTAFCLAFEEKTSLEFHEINALVPSLKLVILEQIAVNGIPLLKGGIETAPSKRVVPYIRAFQHVTQSAWEKELESLIPFDVILRQDPAGAFATMDLQTRNTYRGKVARIAKRSDRTEMEVARKALTLAQQAHARKYADPRIGLRESHIGYYLVAEGASTLCQTVGYHPTFGERFREALRKHPDNFLLVGIAVLAFVIITGILWLLTPATTPMPAILISMLILLLPSSQAAVQLMNYLTTNLLPAEPLPKLDFSEGIPQDCQTLVAIPTLLLNEKQVFHLVEELEVRYLGNHDPNLHFAIVSDLPDSHQPAPEDSALVALCSKLITELNERYGDKKSGSFFHLHRHRVYNPREKGWMGWERKRGKLLDLNQLLRGHFDSFPVKIGNLAILPHIRFVVTLDSDTELPRGSAHRMIGAMAHPLNQAIIDRESNIVVNGYGILQPRVDISVQCTAHSRLAAIFAGETGLDPYSRAVSDVYQDLYGEGSFTGKGIYEVDTMFRVLYGRFPRNSLLSHDLIEGAYARAGLASDIAVIEDYPSHYSAYNRRKHRWLRGDWQIVEWLTNRVPDESGASVPNPISLVSRWKILDNLRRSLVEPATFLLFLFGWFATGHPILWTVAAICILFVPTWVELLFGLTRAVVSLKPSMARDAFTNLLAANLTVLLTLTLLAHQTLLSLDAVVRVMVRRLFTRERLLEWESAAESELKKSRSAIDRYVDWMPFLAAGLGVLIWLTKPHSLLAASPILLLWACAKPLALWLNASPIHPRPEPQRRDVLLLRRSALYIWRYFAEFSSAEHHWLIPDNVQDEPRKIAARVSPTNIGLLLNSRQVANELGYITVPEMIDLTEKTLGTLISLPKYRGHIMNWYETRTIEPKSPQFISSVDNGNLLASLWTLQQGCIDCLHRPLISWSLTEGLLDHLRALVRLRAFPKRELKRLQMELQNENWLASVLNFPEELLRAEEIADAKHAGEIRWFRAQALLRVKNIRSLVLDYMPWLLSDFVELCQQLTAGPIAITNLLPLGQLPDGIAVLLSRLDENIEAMQNGNHSAAQRLKALLTIAHQNAARLVDSVRQTSQQARDLADAMDFTFLLDKQRLLMSVGFDAEAKQLVPYYYDLLATEPRTAVFVAIAKDDVPQDAWFRLDRPFANDDGRTVLLSWTGTMFEYLMPTIWMRSYANTLLDRAGMAAVRSQQAYAASKGIPWGISESASARRNEEDEYHYEAFGVPHLALKKNEIEPLIISPYSTFLALNVDEKSALANLRRMDSLGWFGPYGFFEAADYTRHRKRFAGGARFELVRSWMVHHQGMALLSLANFLCDNVVQDWFHSDRRVRATELLLQEKPVFRPV